MYQANNKPAHPDLGNSDNAPTLLPDEPIKEKTGFELDDLAKAPVKPPELKEAPHTTTRQWHLTLVGLGLVVLAGLLIWPLFGTSAMLVVLVAGACLVALGVLFHL